jgi:hypothetical protein
MSLQLDNSVKVGDILTSLTIFISVIALLLSLAKDRDTKAAEQANKVRRAAADALAKLDRWQGVQLSLYQALQPTFVELSEVLAKNYDVVNVRDLFWKKVNIERTRVAKQVFDEQLGTAYTDLLSHFPAARGKFVEAFAKLSEVEDGVTQSFLADSEQSILSLKDEQTTYTTPVLGNALRLHAIRRTTDLRTKSEAIIAPVREYLFSVIALEDKNIVDVSRAKLDA